MQFFQTTPRMWMGAGAFNMISFEAGALKARRAMIVVGPNVKRVGYADRAVESLASAGVDSEIFADVEPEPSIATAGAVVEESRRFGADLVIGIGGGSSLDVAKLVAVLAGGDAEPGSVLGVDMITERRAGLLLVPTTAGTGTEVTPVSVLVDSVELRKRVAVSPHLFPDVAILDPGLTLTLPPDATASSGMDALTHAVEAYTSRNAGPLTDMFAAEAVRLVSLNLRHACRDGGDIEARERMLLSSMLAGKAFGNAGVTAVHAFAHVVGARYGIPHGIANAILLAHVMEFNMPEVAPRLRDIAGFMGEDVSGLDDGEGARVMIGSIRELASDLGLPGRLSAFGMEEKDIPGLVEEVLADKRLLGNNRRRVEPEDAEAILRSAL